MSKKRIAIIAASIIVALGVSETLFGWPWNTDMYWQPSIRALERAPMAPPVGSISLNAEPEIDRVKAGETLANPMAGDNASVERGRALFATFCAVCHGERGRGDGPIAKKIGAPPDLTQPMYAQMTDGYIFGTIRNGGATMPALGDALSTMDRWDIVNFVRSLQKQ